MEPFAWIIIVFLGLVSLSLLNLAYTREKKRIEREEEELAKEMEMWQDTEIWYD